MISRCSAVNFISGTFADNTANLNASDFSFQETFSVCKGGIFTFVGGMFLFGDRLCLHIHLILALSLPLALGVEHLPSLLEDPLTNLNMLLEGLLGELSAATLRTLDQFYRNVRLLL